MAIFFLTSFGRHCMLISEKQSTHRRHTVNCPRCQATHFVKYGHVNKVQRYRCPHCRYQWTRTTPLCWIYDNLQKSILIYQPPASLIPAYHRLSDRISIGVFCLSRADRDNLCAQKSHAKVSLTPQLSQFHLIERGLLGTRTLAKNRSKKTNEQQIMLEFSITIIAEPNIF